MFITFEGIDCCGKSTQARMLAERLKQTGRDVILLREPGNTRLSEHVRNILLNKEFNEMNERTELLLFAASRAQLVAEVILPALDRDSVVICDRFYDSTTAYQGYGRQLPLEDIMHINRIATQDLVPDMTFFIDVSPEVALERCRERFMSDRDRMEESGVRFYERVINGYMTLAQNERGRFFVVDGSNTPSDVHVTVARLVQDRLPHMLNGFALHETIEAVAA
ncbi:MAG TPA: dTMP kinase [Candidatus Kapabacteria bacterium]|nr:dTMP kinase [Candidatus Kapabacteria bacterium]